MQSFAVQVMGGAGESAGAARCSGVLQLAGGQSGRGLESPRTPPYAQQSAGRLLRRPEDLSGLPPQVRAQTF